MKVAFLLSGQGSQKLGMGLELYENFSIAKRAFEEASDALNLDAKRLCFEANDELDKTHITQPMILLLSYIGYKVLKSELGIYPHVALGHSLGEVNAYILTSRLSLGAGIGLVHNRGLLMERACANLEAGMMVVLGLDAGQIEDFCKDREDIYVANYNMPTQIVLAGKKAALEEAGSALKKLGAKRALLLPMNISSHCPLLAPIVPEFEGMLEATLQDNASIDIISNVTTKPYHEKSEAKKLLSAQLTSPVRWDASIGQVDSSVDVYFELGGSVLSGMNKKLSSKKTYPVTNLKDIETIKAELDLLDRR